MAAMMSVEVFKSASQFRPADSIEPRDALRTRDDNDVNGLGVRVGAVNRAGPSRRHLSRLSFESLSASRFACLVFVVIR
jgi:hypothetical protein